MGRRRVVPWGFTASRAAEVPMIAHNGPRTIGWSAPQEGEGAPLPAPDPFAPLFPGEEVGKLVDSEIDGGGVRMTVAVYETRPERTTTDA